MTSNALLLLIMVLLRITHVEIQVSWIFQNSLLVGWPPACQSKARLDEKKLIWILTWITIQSRPQ